MSNLNGKYINGENAWDVYVKTNQYRAFTKYEMDAGTREVEFYTKFTDIPKNPSDIILSYGDKFIIISPQTYNAGLDKYANIRFNNIPGYIKTSAIRRPLGNLKEERTLFLSKINIDKLREISGIGRVNSNGVSINVPGIGMLSNIVDVEKVSNKIHGKDAKTDILFRNSSGKRVFYLSHKNNGGSDAFSQYAGETESISGSFKNSPSFFNYPEVQSYLTRLYNLYSDAVNETKIVKNNPFDSSGRLTKGIYRYINDPQLVNNAVFGSRINAIGQGQFIFTPSLYATGDIYFDLSFSSEYFSSGNTDTFMNNNSSYRAVLYTSNRIGRPTATPYGDIPNIKTGIYPKYYASSSVPIDTFII
jgi:hypothetical protein